MTIKKALEIFVKELGIIEVGLKKGNNPQSIEYNRENILAVITLFKSAEAWLTLKDTLATSMIPWDWKYTKETVDKIIIDIEKETIDGDD